MMLLYKKNNQLSKNKYILRCVIVSIYLLSLIFYINGDEISYFKIIDIMNIVFIGAIILATNSKYSKNDRLALYLGKGLMIIASVYIMKYIFLDYIMMTEYNYNSTTFFQLLGITLELCEVGFIALVIKNKNNSEDSFIKQVFFIIIAIIVIMIIAINMPINVIDAYYRNAINYVLSLTLYAYTYLVIFNNRLSMTESKCRAIFLFVSMMFINSLASGFSCNMIINGAANIYTAMSYALSYFAYYFLYEGFITSSLEKYYNDIHNCILRKEDDIKQKNIILKKERIS